MKIRVLIMLLLCAERIFATAVGTVLYTAEVVKAQHGKVSHILTRGSLLNVGDVILTARNATAQIKYANGTLVTIGPNSTYRISAYEPQQQVVLKAKLSRGKIVSETAVGEKKHEALTTPLVTLAINGTKFKVFVPSNKKTYIQLIQGQISVDNQILTPGESVVATGLSISPAIFPNAGTIKESNGMVTTSHAQTTTAPSAHGSSAKTSSTIRSTMKKAPSSLKSVSAATNGATVTSFIDSTVVVTQATMTGASAINNVQVPIVPDVPVIALLPFPTINVATP